jgi:hypothetical protein
MRYVGFEIELTVLERDKNAARTALYLLWALFWMRDSLDANLQIESQVNICRLELGFACKVSRDTSIEGPLNFVRTH